MTFANSAGIGVSNNYGVRTTAQTVGVERSSNSEHQLSITFTGETINNSFLPPVVMPKGALIRGYVLRVDEAFSLTGSSPTIRFGSLGSVSTNGVVLSETELENIGTKVPSSTGAGTWAVGSSTGVAAAAKVDKDFGGGSPVVSTTVGKATLIIKYAYKTKV